LCTIPQSTVTILDSFSTKNLRADFLVPIMK
jgi:hypothetical protein